MVKPYRYRIHAGKAGSKLRKGGSASSNPTTSHFRNQAKIERRLKHEQLVAIDDVLEKRSSVKHINNPMKSMNINAAAAQGSRKRKPSASIVSGIHANKRVAFSADTATPNAPARSTTAATLTIDELRRLCSFAACNSTKVLSSLRATSKEASALESTDDRRQIMSDAAQAYMPILFKLYCSPIANETRKEVEGAVISKDVRISALEAIRAFVQLTRPDALREYAKQAILKLNDKDEDETKRWLVTDIVIALCRGVDAAGATLIFDAVCAWFTERAVGQRSLQKKAYRVLDELYNRREDATLEPFFTSVAPRVAEIVGLPANEIDVSAWPPRLVALRLVLRSLKTLPECQKMSASLLEEVVACMDKSRSRPTRQNAAHLFASMISQQFELAGDNENAKIQALDTIEATIYDLASRLPVDEDEEDAEVPLERARPALIAANLLAQQQLRSMNGALVVRFLNHALELQADERAPIRALAIRLMRMFAKKMPDFTLREYQRPILETIFIAHSAENNTSSVRKAISLLFGVLIDKFGYEVVCKYAKAQSGWLKLLKKLEKTRRQKQGKQLPTTDDHDAAAPDTQTVISESKSARPDSIFYMLDNSDDNMRDEDDEDIGDRRSRASRRSSVWIREGRAESDAADDEDELDLLDAKSVLSRVVTSRPSEVDDQSTMEVDSKVKRRGASGLRFAPDGRLIVEDDKTTKTGVESDDDDEDED